MRKLNGGDLFNAVRLLRAVDLKGVVEAYQKAAAAEEGEEKQNANMALFGKLMESASDEKSEDAIFAFLAGPFGKKNAAEVRAMPLDELGDCLEKLGEENDLRGFFGKASHMTRML